MALSCVPSFLDPELRLRVAPKRAERGRDDRSGPSPVVALTDGTGWTALTVNTDRPLFWFIGSADVTSMASDRRDDSKLRKVSANSIDCRSLLADEQVPGSVQCQATLLLWRLGRDEPRVWVTVSQIASASVASFLCRFT
jgi:hypothetical protein